MNPLPEHIPPEHPLELSIMNDPEWMEGADWGWPREGHPEGKVIFHIQEVLANINRLNPNPEDRKKLRIIGLIHDTFKNKVDFNQPRVGENHHAMFARRFAEKYTSDPDILDIIELHDEAFNSWRKGEETQKWEKAEERLQKLLERLGTPERIQLYYDFYKCDNETGSKNQSCIQWFEGRVATVLIRKP